MICKLQSPLADIEFAIANALNELPPLSGKFGKSTLQPSVGSAIERAGFRVDYEDSKGLLGACLPVWRDKNTREIEKTVGRRLIDIVVYDDYNRAIALIETESDLDDLRELGVTKRNGHYDVFSIAKDASGTHFHSYKSLERMAAASFFRAVQVDGRIDHFEMTQRLVNLSSDIAAEHNPLGMGIFLVTGRCRPKDRQILANRLESLNAVLLSPK
jgi:hypothetical protein